MKISKLESIKTFSYRHEAEMAKGLLEEQEIESIISADDCGGFTSHIAFTSGGIQLMVKKKDIEKAKEILET